MLIGVGEIGTKTLEAVLIRSTEIQPLLLAFFSGSVPIHVALSLAYYSIWNGRLWKTASLHVLINGTGAFAGMALWSQATPTQYVTLGLVVITSLCAVIGVLSLRQMRMRREVALSDAGCEATCSGTADGARYPLHDCLRPGDLWEFP